MHMHEVFPGNTIRVPLILTGTACKPDVHRYRVLDISLLVPISIFRDCQV
jgi:hypothetical protein